MARCVICYGPKQRAQHSTYMWCVVGVVLCGVVVWLVLCCLVLLGLVVLCVAVCVFGVVLLDVGLVGLVMRRERG